MSMTNNLKTLSALLLGMGALASPYAFGSDKAGVQVQAQPQAQAQADSPVAFHVREWVLQTPADVLTQKSQDALRAALASTSGPHKTMAQLHQALARAQQVLDQLAPGAFVAQLPAQTLDDGGRVLVQILPVLGQVSVLGLSGDEAQKALAALPASLQKGALLTADNWPSASALSLLNDHPLKVTAVNYRIQRDRPVQAEVSVQAPYGASQTLVSLDSYGNDVIGRGLLTFSHVAGDVWTHNDVVSLTALTSARDPSQVGMGALRYSLANPARLTQHALGLVHAANNVESPFLTLGNITGKGAYSEVSYRQTHYLNPTQGSGVSNAKLFAEVALNQAKASTHYGGAMLTDYSVVALPFTLGLEAFVQSGSAAPERWLREASALVRAQLIVNAMGALGTSGQADYAKARVGAGSSVALRVLADSRSTWLGQWRTNAQFTGQYSADNLLPASQMSIAGDRSGVRGFVNAALLGDRAAVLRLELEPLALRSTLYASAVQPYAFYDAGHKQGGNDGRQLSVSSTGVGLRVTPLQARGLTLEAFAAHKLNGKALDLKPGTSSQVDATTLWLTASYRL